MYCKMVKWDEIAPSNTASAEQWSKKCGHLRPQVKKMAPKF